MFIVSNPSTGILSTLVLFLLFIIYILIWHHEAAEKWFAKILRFFVWAGRTIEKKHVALDIQGHLNSFSKKIENELSGALPYPAKIKWVTETDRATFIEKKEVVIKMARYTDQDKNRVTAAIEYVSKGFLPHSREYVHPKVMTALDLTIVKQLLSSRRDNSARQYFSHQRLKPVLQNDNELENLCSQLEDMSYVGLLVPVLLFEFVSLERLFPRNPSNSIQNATKNFTHFLHSIAMRERGETQLPKDYKNYPIATGIILIARSEKRQLGTSPYIKAVDYEIKRGVNAIHLLARGNNVSFVKEVAKELKGDRRITSINSTGFSIQPSERYEHELEAIVITLRIRPPSNS